MPLVPGLGDSRMLKPSRLMRYGVAVLSVALALMLTLLLQPLLSPTALPLFFLAVTFSVWYGGRGAGFVATVLSVLASRYFLLPPLHSFLPIPGTSIVELIVFGLVTLLVSMLEIDLRISDRRNQNSLRELAQARAALRESDARFHITTESSFDAIFLLKSVRNRAGEIVDFEFVDLNEQGAKLISRSKSEIIHQSLCQLLPINRTQGFFEKYKQVVETGIPLVEEFPSSTMPGVSAAWLHHQVVPLNDGLAITTRDISDRKQAEASLQASEALYRTLAEAMPQLIWTQDATGKIDYANQQWLNALGVTLEAVNREGWMHLVHPNDLPKLLDRQAVSMRRGDIREAEFRYRMADGSYRWFLGRSVPIKDEQGQVIKWVGTSTDIHDLKRYEQELAKQKRRFKTLAENSPDIITRIDRNLRHVYINSAIQKATGMPPEAFIGKTHEELDIPEHLRQDWRCKLKQVFAAGEGCAYEFAFPAPDGMRHYLARMVPEFASSGAVESVLGITSDITEFKRVEQSLRESEVRFRRLMASNMLGMGFWELDGNISEVNDALLEILGYTRQEFLAERPRWTDLTPIEYRAAESQALEQIRQSGVCIPFEKEYIRRDGSRVPILCGGAAFHNAEDGGVFFVLDLSDRKQIEKERNRLLQLERAARAEAEAANRVKNEFLMVLSHELRTPLNPILGWTRLLQTRQFSPEMTAHALDAIERNARQEVQLVEDLLDMSRILQGKLSLDIAPVSLLEVIEGVIDSVRLSAEAKSIQIQTDLDDSVKPVLGNQVRLQQVAWNLLSNAIKFTPHQGQIKVSLQQVGKFAQVQVRDTGKGIEASFIPYVFDYFRQSNGSTTRSAGGLGLGLAITRHLVELHGGTIEAASEGEGKGAVFTVQLPIPVDDRKLISGYMGGLVSEFTLKDKRIVVVESDADARELLTVILKQAGAEVDAVETVDATLAALARSQPDLLIGAIEILQKNECELMQRLRLWSQEFGEEIPIVALAPYPEAVDAQSALAIGLQHILPSSIEPDALIDAIEQLTAY